MKSFKGTTSLESELYPIHNELISGDELFTIQLNYKWRKLIAGLLENAWHNDLSTMSLDNQDSLSALILDLYNAEVIGTSMLTTVYRKTNGALRQTTSTSFVDTTEQISHVFTKPNALIAWSNMLLANTNSAGNTWAQVRLDDAAASGSGSSESLGQNPGLTARPTRTSSVFVGIAAGSHDINLYFRATANTAQITANTEFMIEIIEYD